MCRPPQFNTFEECFDKNIAYEMFSFSESKAYGFIMNQPKLFTMYNKFQISRIYPYWKRINSDNLMPQIFWNVGCQMVALNYQTPDLPIMLNHAKFEYNNRRGYISKPACLHLYRHEAFKLHSDSSLQTIQLCEISPQNNHFFELILATPFCPSLVRSTPSPPHVNSQDIRECRDHTDYLCRHVT